MAEWRRKGRFKKQAKGKPASYDHIKKGWLTVGGKRYYFKSGWEANYACYLEYQKSIGLLEDWEYEPKTFYFEGIKRGTTNYTPDFRVQVNDKEHYYVEVKGYLTAKDKTKLKRMAKYHPDEELVVVDRKVMKRINDLLGGLIDGWIKI